MFFFRQTLFILAAFLAAPLYATDVALVPQPKQITIESGSFRLDAQTEIVADKAAENEAQFLITSLAPATGIKFARRSDSAKPEGSIVLRIVRGQSNLGPESYSLKVTPTQVIAEASQPAGLFYAVQILRQLLPPAVFAATKQQNVNWKIPCCTIVDAPRFAWRGFMLDSSRMFVSKESVLRTLDLVAMHKLNVFHWHLTDDHGWRIEIKKYPLLTQLGAWREQPPVGRYGGFYTQDEIREVVAYASRLHITVVPEIEIPGHSRAALAAYPNLACGNQPTIVDHLNKLPMTTMSFPPMPGSNVYCAGKEETFTFLNKVLDEVIGLFPSEYIHVGGDEVPPHYWQNCTECRKRMKDNKLAGPAQLQGYVLHRIEEHLKLRGRKLIGWDEIMEGGLSPTASITSWRGTSGGIRAAQTGHDAVMCPGKPLYFDHRQSASAQHPPGFGGSVETLQEVYAFEPVPATLNADQAKHILGVQANLWTCLTHNEELRDLFAFPRLCALAEVAWRPSEVAKDYSAFKLRLDRHLARLDCLGVNYWRDNAVEIGRWSPDQKLKEWSVVDYDVSRKLSSPGSWSITFAYERGSDALEMRSVELLAAGRSIAVDRHNGHTGWNNKDNVYTLAVEKGMIKEPLLVRAEIRTMTKGGVDSTGRIGASSQSPKIWTELRSTSGLSCTTPVTQDRDRATYNWMTRHAEILKRHETIKPDVVIIGDSITHYWGGEPQAPIARSPDAWATAFGKKNVTNLGYGWDRTENVLWRIEHGELDGIAPKCVVLLIGTNNLSINTAGEIAAAIETICVRIHDKLPDAKILVLGILPRHDQQRLKADLDHVNFLLETRLHRDTWLQVVDLGNQFRNADGSFNGKLFSDGLHPNNQGYGIMADAIAKFTEQH